ncbi:MAG TPA: hypothetical protein VGB79_08085 [Allosphingosinicella sp.]|jgi:hypothetical protein
MPLWVPITAALLGALAGGLFQALLRLLDRQRERATTLVALVSEVGVISEIVRNERYLEKLAAIAGAVDSDPRVATISALQMKIDRFAIFESLAPKLGLLGETQARNIVQFYSLFRYAVDAAAIIYLTKHDPALRWFQRQGVFDVRPYQSDLSRRQRGPRTSGSLTLAERPGLPALRRGRTRY